MAALALCACSTARTTKDAANVMQSTLEVDAALKGKTRLEVEEYFGRKPDKDMQATCLYRGKFYTPGEKNVWTTAVVVFSHFEPDQVWSVAFTD